MYDPTESRRDDFECEEKFAAKDCGRCAGECDGEICGFHGADSLLSFSKSGITIPTFQIVRKYSIHSSQSTTFARVNALFPLTCSQYFLSSESPVTKTSQYASDTTAWSRSTCRFSFSFASPAHLSEVNNDSTLYALSRFTAPFSTKIEFG